LILINADISFCYKNAIIIVTGLILTTLKKENREKRKVAKGNF